MKKKLQLRTETIRSLSSELLAFAAGGADRSALTGCGQQPHSKFGQTCDSKCSSCVFDP
jgi:hypothetical protein